MICCCLWILVIVPFYCVWPLLPLLTQCNMVLSHAVPKTRVMVCLLFLRQIFIFLLSELGTLLLPLCPCRVEQHTAPTFIITLSLTAHSCSYLKQRDAFKIFELWMAKSSFGRDREILVLAALKSLLLYCVLDTHHQKSCHLWYIFDKQWTNSIFFFFKSQIFLENLNNFSWLEMWRRFLKKPSCLPFSILSLCTDVS